MCLKKSSKINRMNLLGIPILVFLMSFLSIKLHAQSLYTYVDPFIGSAGDGHIFVGPSCPFGMVKPGPDCNVHSNSGYDADTTSTVFGFSQVHVSGTGGGPKYGNISMMPFQGNFNSIYQESSRSNEKASCGYYTVTLKKWNIKVPKQILHLENRPQNS